MYFTGANATNAENTTLDVLQDIIEQGFAQEPFAAKFRPYNGVEVTHQPNDLKGPPSRRPLVFLEVVSNDTRDFKKKVGGVLREGARHELEISAECVTLDGTAPVERELREALVAIVGRAYARLRERGLEGSTIRAGKSNRDTPNIERINPHTITCAVHTLNV